VTLDEFLEACRRLADDAPARIADAASPAEFADVRTQLVGRKQGRLADLMTQLASLPPEARRDAGRAVNDVKQTIERLLDEREAAWRRRPVRRRRSISPCRRVGAGRDRCTRSRS
jgi:phenylalanyl-tRNA synthetase alpha subunit